VAADAAIAVISMHFGDSGLPGPLTRCGNSSLVGPVSASRHHVLVGTARLLWETVCMSKIGMRQKPKPSKEILDMIRDAKANSRQKKSAAKPPAARIREAPDPRIV
jgi:hypothetical protein